MQGNVTIVVRLPAEVKRDLERRAVENERTVSQEVRLALRAAASRQSRDSTASTAS